MSVQLTQDPADAWAWVVKTGAKIDADGSPRAYGPNNSGLDYNANGGPPHAPYGYELNPATGYPFVQGEDAPAYSAETKGFYVSATTYERRKYPRNDPRRYLNSEREVFVVVTGAFRRHVPGIVIGGKCVVRYNGREVSAVMGDVGPDFGEMSIACAAALGIDADARHGGVTEGVEYRFYPGVAAPGYELQAA